jgi:O-Antigen ligase
MLEVSPAFELERGRTHSRMQLVPAFATFAPVLGLAAAQGGYFPTSWGWASVPLFWTAAVALVWRGEIGFSRLERCFIGAAVVFVGWLALSTVWSVAPAESVLEVERALVYVASILAVLVLARTGATRFVLGALLCAISLIALFSLATRLVPDRVGVYDGAGVYRLAEPIGYWNGVAVFTAMGALLALGFAARARTVVARSLGAAALVLMLATFYFTFGRAAWIALAAGVVAAVASDPRRLQLLAVGLAVTPAAAIGVLISTHETGLTHAGIPLARAAHDGHRLALVLVVLASVNAVVAAAVCAVERRFEVGAPVRRAFAGLVVAMVLAGGVAGVVAAGGPVHVVKRAYTAFKAPPPHVKGNLNQRLLSFSGNGRAGLWHLAWEDARLHPALGSGAGTYERYFLAHQPANIGRVRDAHSLYVETLAEVGPVGLVLLLAFLLTPLVAVRSARRHPLVPVAVGVYVAYLVHTGVDWDWELPAVTLTGLLAGAAILLAARGSLQPPPLPTWGRWSLAGAAAVAAAFASMTLIGTLSLSRSETARKNGDYAAAASSARRARTLLPWSPTPWEALGRAQSGAGADTDARQSFRKAITLDRGNWQLWYDLSTVTSGRERTRALHRVQVLFPRSGLGAQS